MTEDQARYRARSIARRLEEIRAMMRRDPGLVRVATNPSGDRVAFWYSNGSEANYNLDAAERELRSIEKIFPSATKSRTGRVIELPIG